MPNRPVAPVSGRAFTAGQDFLLGAKAWWSTEMYPALRAEHDDEERARRAEQRDAYVQHLMESLLGEQLSKGTP